MKDQDMIKDCDIYGPVLRNVWKKAFMKINFNQKKCIYLFNTGPMYYVHKATIHFYRFTHLTYKGLFTQFDVTIS